ncbi:hypothetical protein IIA79_02380 [bacterium]|nr:hypothetical protein [bacterium]
MRIARITIAGLTCMFLAAQAAVPAESDPYGGTYTPEELAAIDRALWAGNMTREDLGFDKDYAKGYECFPIVREMMDDPLMIAPWMDRIANGICDESEMDFISQLIALLSSELVGEDKAMPYADWAGFTRNAPYTAEDATADWLQLFFETDWGTLVSPFRIDELEHNALRVYLPKQMAWHDVFYAPEDLSDAQLAEFKSYEDNDIAEWIYETLAARAWEAYDSGASVDFLLNFGDAGEWGKILPAELFNQESPLLIETAIGLICLGTYGDDIYENLDFTVLIEPGGNDYYYNCRLAGHTGDLKSRGKLFLDLGGDDFYDCADVDITLGAAVLGVAAFYDLGGGNDRYYAGSCSLGAAMGGIATFYDDGGSDYYSGKVFTQGAAGFGIGIMVDDSVGDAPVFDTAEGNDDAIDAHERDPSQPDVRSAMDNDYYTAWSEAQAFARTRGIALCINRRGNEVYHAGGVYLHAPLFSDRYQSFSQGFAIGEREIDYAGGIAMLIDYAGNDRYLGDVYSQGVGYWYSAGLLWDGGGNDTYEMTQYGQGSGIHLAVGGLVDVSGNDTYVMHAGLGQGGSHDYAASILHDRGGNDHYMGMTSCNGTGLTNAVGIHIDRSGNDTYAGRRNGGVNWGRPARGTSSIGLLLDLAGEDDYLGIMEDGLLWRQADIAVGWDVDQEAHAALLADVSSGAAVPGRQEDGGRDARPTEGSKAELAAPLQVEIPAIVAYEGEITQEVFDELWEIAKRWAVGDNAAIVPQAIERLVAFGLEVLPFVAAEMDDDYSLALRAYTGVLKPLHEEWSVDVEDVLEEQAQSGHPKREKVALYLVGELDAGALEHIPVRFLEHDDPSMVRRAIGVLGVIGSHAADERLIAMLDPEANDEAKIKAALITLTDLEVDCYDDLRPLLAYPKVSVREALVKQLVKKWEAYGEQVFKDYFRAIEMLLVGEAKEDNVERSLRTILHVLARVDVPDDRAQITMLVFLMGPGIDWGVRADAIRVARHWQELSDGNAEQQKLLEPMLNNLEAFLQSETDPYVLFVANQ